MNGGIMEMVMDKVKPLFDKKIDEAKKEILEKINNVEAKLDEVIKEIRR